MPFCANCGQETSGANFCPNCGMPQESQQATYSQDNTQSGYQAGPTPPEGASYEPQTETFTYDQSVGSQQVYDTPVSGETTFDSTVNYDAQYVYAQQQAQAAAAAADQGSFGWSVLGFIFPIVGLILFLVWRETKPVSGKQAGVGALVGVIVSVVLSALAMCAGVALVAVSGSY